MNNRENIIKAIENLLAKANDKGATEAEAMQASKAAQRLMAKYHIESLDLGKVKDNITGNYTPIRERHWMYMLATIVAHNFCCECFTTDEYDKEQNKFVKVATFYGREIDTVIAQKVFKSLVQTAQTGIRKHSQKYYRLYGTRKGVEKAYTQGFNKAVRQALEENCRALVLVIPQEVKDKYKRKYGSKLKTIKHNARISISTGTEQTIRDIYRQGMIDGRNAAQRRKLHKD